MKTVYRTVEGCRQSDQTIIRVSKITDAGAVVESPLPAELANRNLESGRLNAAIQAAAAQGSWSAQNDLGCIHEGGYGGVPRDAAKAAAWYRKAADQGFAQAQHNLGVLNERGRGVEKNLALAYELYHQAAQQGNPASQYNLATLYALGAGTERDLNQSLHWFCEAGRRQFGNAAEMVLYVQGEIHRAGRSDKAGYSAEVSEAGIVPSAAPAALLAVFVLRETSAPTEEEIMTLLADSFGALFGAHAVPALLKFKACQPAGEGGYRFSSNLTRGGDVRAMMKDFIRATGNGDLLRYTDHYETSYLDYVSGENKEPTCVALVFGPEPNDFEPLLVDAAGIALRKGDSKEAVRLLRKASDQGIAQAQYNLGILLYQGQGVERDYQDARKWFESAARQHYANAAYMYAFMLENGQGGAKDFSGAFGFYRQAAQFDEPDSIYKLALLHLSVEHQRAVGVAPRAEGWDFVPVDHAEARRLLLLGRNLDHRLCERALALLEWGWPPLRITAKRQNLKLRKSFEARGAQGLDYAVERWDGLFALPLWGKIEQEVLRLHGVAGASGKPATVRIEEPGDQGRVLLLTVAKGNLSTLVNSFPGGDYGPVYRQERQRFREVPFWQLRDFVHWMFAWDQHGCENHMLYQFSKSAIDQLVEYQIEDQTNQGPVPPFEVFHPPGIIPESVISVPAFRRILDEEELLEDEMLKRDSR